MREPERRPRSICTTRIFRSSKETPMKPVPTRRAFSSHGGRPGGALAGRLPLDPHRPSPGARVALPSDSLGLYKEPLRPSKARRTLALTRAIPCPPSDGWTDALTTIHPSDHRGAMTLCGQDGIVESTCFEGYRFGYSRGTQRKRSETTPSLTCENYGGPSGVRTLDLGIKSRTSFDLTLGQ